MPRQRRRRRGLAGATGTRPRHGPTSLCPVPRCSDPASGLCVESAPRAAFRDPGLRDFTAGFRGFLFQVRKFFTDRPALGPAAPLTPLLPGRLQIRDVPQARRPLPAPGGFAARVQLPRGGYALPAPPNPGLRPAPPLPSSPIETISSNPAPRETRLKQAPPITDGHRAPPFGTASSRRSRSGSCTRKRWERRGVRAQRSPS